MASSAASSMAPSSTGLPHRTPGASATTLGADATAVRTILAPSHVPDASIRKAAATPSTGKSKEPRRRSLR